MTRYQSHESAIFARTKERIFALDLEDAEGLRLASLYLFAGAIALGDIGSKLVAR